MQIILDTDTADADQLTALIALCASLGGRLPTGWLMPSYDLTGSHIPADEAHWQNLNGLSRDERAAGPVNFANTSTTDFLESERLLAEAAASRTAPPPPAATGPDDEDGQTFDPASLDASGVPWDERIHSSNRKRTGDDMWRKRRGVDEVTFGRVHGELSERVALAGGQPGEPAALSPTTFAITGTSENGAGSPSTTTAPTPPAPPPPATDGPAAPPPPPVPSADAPLAQPTVPNAPPPPPTNAASVPTAGAPTSAPAASAGGSGQFPEFKDFVTAVSKITSLLPKLNEISNVLEVPAFKDMRAYPDKWDMFYDMISG